MRRWGCAFLAFCHFLQFLFSLHLPSTPSDPLLVSLCFGLIVPSLPPFLVASLFPSYSTLHCPFREPLFVPPRPPSTKKCIHRFESIAVAVAVAAVVFVFVFVVVVVVVNAAKARSFFAVRKSAAAPKEVRAPGLRSIPFLPLGLNALLYPNSSLPPSTPPPAALSYSTLSTG